MICIETRCVLFVVDDGEIEGGGTEGEGDVDEGGGCIDRQGATVPEGAMYKPESDPCIECMCRDGRPTRCLSVICQPPDCNWELIEGECCQFRCIDAGNDTQPPAHCMYLCTQVSRKTGPLSLKKSSQKLS